MAKYVITAPSTPGAQPTVQGIAGSLRAARAFARNQFGARRDLKGQDVRIERPDGQLVEYVGPAR